MQETARAIVERKSPDAIENLRAFFYVALIREIDHQLGRPTAIPDADISADFGPQPVPHFPPAAPVPRRRADGSCTYESWPKQCWTCSSGSAPATC